MDVMSIGAVRDEGSVQLETKYARLGRDRIAYQVLGEGPPDLVMTNGSFGHVDMAWEDPGIALFYSPGTRPEGTRALILANATARYLAADDYPIGVPAEVAEPVLAQLDQLWG